MVIRKLTITVMVLLLLVGCDSTQMGKYSIGHVKQHYFHDPDGVVLEFVGNRINASGNIVGDETGILFVVFLIDSSETDPLSRTRSSHQKHVSRFEKTDADGKGLVVSWNRKSDIVEIEEQVFDRTEGNVIVVEKNEGKDSSFFHLKFEESINNTSDLLKRISENEPKLDSLSNSKMGNPPWDGRGKKNDEGSSSDENVTG